MSLSDRPLSLFLALYVCVCVGVPVCQSVNLLLCSALRRNNCQLGGGVAKQSRRTVAARLALSPSLSLSLPFTLSSCMCACVYLKPDDKKPCPLPASPPIYTHTPTHTHKTLSAVGDKWPSLTLCVCVCEAVCVSQCVAVC